MERIEKNEFLVKKVQKLQQLCRPEKDWILPQESGGARICDGMSEHQGGCVHSRSGGHHKPASQSSLVGI
jgi:hypothetical protein